MGCRQKPLGRQSPKMPRQERSRDNSTANFAQKTQSVIGKVPNMFTLETLWRYSGSQVGFEVDKNKMLLGLDCLGGDKAQLQKRWNGQLKRKMFLNINFSQGFHFAENLPPQA